MRSREFLREMEDTPSEVLRALDQAAQKNGYRNWADVKANPRSESAVMTVAKLANTILRTTGPHHEKIFYKSKIDEVNSPDELSISDKIQQYFFKRGYDLAGEGRDQMAFESPRGTIVKVLGTGDAEREQVVRDYVEFFQRNQRNPYYPRIYSSGEFTVGDETYFVYEMERVNYVANEEATLDYIEKLMSAVDREQGEQFLQQNPVPPEMTEDEVFGLIQATEDMMQALGGMAPLDLNAVENLGRRDNGHLVIVDPYSL